MYLEKRFIVVVYNHFIALLISYVETTYDEICDMGNHHSPYIISLARFMIK